MRREFIVPVGGLDFAVHEMEEPAPVDVTEAVTTEVSAYLLPATPGSTTAE
jgi:hypothetical protein